MKRNSALMILGLLGIVWTGSGLATAFASGDRIEIRSEDSGVFAPGTSRYEFTLFDTQTQKALGDADLRITHEKRLHMFVYDRALREFQHVHPEFDGRIWSVDLDFAVDGEYWMWTQGELEAEHLEFTASASLRVAGGGAAWPLPPVLGENRRGASGNSVAEVSARRLVAGRSVMLGVKFSRSDGSLAEITPYLGAFAHIVAVPAAGNEILHVHPMTSPEPNEGILHTTFPAAGDYRLWIQFKDGGELKVVPLSVTVHAR